MIFYIPNSIALHFDRLSQESDVKRQFRLLEPVPIVDSSKRSIIEEAVADIPGPDEGTNCPQALKSIQLSRPEGLILNFIQNIKAKNGLRTL